MNSSLALISSLQKIRVMEEQGKHHYIRKQFAKFRTSNLLHDND